ncbi:hypothetical protein AVEN_138679-1 [Araneus ventricosus]|uniref:Uncharacterized protein n=1 Tax=Araneus ventricosus TaxID=182803 RepID=A0A4Y2RUH3_ARAVE|nr:hypothetical protein AVEN_138679-1 [Araneus ventricosus]
MPYYIHLADHEKDMKILEDGLLHLKMIHSTPSQPVEALIFLLKPSNLPRIVLFGLHSVCLFYEIREFKNAKKRMLSNDLRVLASHFERLLRSTDTALNLGSHQSVNFT